MYTIETLWEENTCISRLARNFFPGKNPVMYVCMVFYFTDFDLQYKTMLVIKYIEKWRQKSVIGQPLFRHASLLLNGYNVCVVKSG